MTAEEVIKTIELAKAEVEWEKPLDWQIAFDMAIVALKKQIPKKIVRKSCTEKSILACPNCGVNLGIEFYGEDGKINGLQCIDDIPPVARCCKFCGQSIID